MDADSLSRFTVQTVGNSLHQELWVPAEDLDTFNRHIQGPIRFIEAWYGPEYRGPDTTLGPLESQGLALLKQSGGALPRLQALIQANAVACLFNFAWWASSPAPAQGLDSATLLTLLDRVREAWVALYPVWPLPIPGGNRQTAAQ